MKTLTNYITRYASHPPISERRIISINDDNHTITWFYDPTLCVWGNQMLVNYQLSSFKGVP